MDAFDEVRNMGIPEIADSCNTTANPNNGYHTNTDLNADEYNAEDINYKNDNSTAEEYQPIEQENQNTDVADLEITKEEEKLNSEEQPLIEEPTIEKDPEENGDEDGEEEDKDTNEKISNGLDTEEKDETVDKEEEETTEVDTISRREKESKNYKEDDDEDDDDQLPLAKRMTNSNKKQSGNSKPSVVKRGPRGPYNKNRSKLEPIAPTETESGDGLDENQCRVCLVKEDLISIFKTDNKLSIADKLMNVCSGIRIQRKDFLPQFICNTCMQSVQVAYNLKVLCETTDKDLRSKLSRSKKKMRRPATEYVLLDATKFPSDESDNDLEDNDDEFKLSNEEVVKSSGTDPTDSGSDYGSRRRSRRVRTKKPQKKKREIIKPIIIASPPPPVKSAARPTPVAKKPGSTNSAAKRNRKESSSPEKRPSADFSSGSEDNYTPPARKRKEVKNKSGSTPINAPKEAQCPYCNEILPSQSALIKHKKTHSNQPLNCEMCGKSFKLLAAYQAHVEKHKTDGDSLKCDKCEKTFTKLVERKRHMIEVHNEKPETFPCEKCKRVFALKKTLERHLEDGKCPGPKPPRPPVPTPVKKAKSDVENLTLGRDLFKCVAPLTTTYWSDSFSE
ncbi:zinc finger protein weckle [Condylostylus longicornis]|uniref:zinc finger protein weckle n=1 Tax=Condylostylus longicornis TaxID=2530218 RepID=UPI00244E0E7B|nr:zinc finger protein weckle [Condylostylus longicornis]